MYLYFTRILVYVLVCNRMLLVCIPRMLLEVLVWCFSQDPEIPEKFSTPRKLVSCSLFLEFSEMLFYLPVSISGNAQ